jgi:hypothetical protein
MRSVATFVLSGFRERFTPEARFPRRTLLDSPLIRGTGSLLTPLTVMYLIDIVEVVEKGGETNETNTTALYDGHRYGGNDGDVRPVSERTVSLSAHRALRWHRYPPDT